MTLRAAAPQRRTNAFRALAWTVGLGVPLLFLGVFFVWPVLSLVLRGFVTDGTLDFSGFIEVLGEDRTWRIITQTLIQASLGTVISVLLGIPGAYVLYRRRFRGQRIVRAIVTTPFVLPTVVVGVAFRSLFLPSGALGWLNRWWQIDGSLLAIVLALVFFNYAIVVRTVGSMWDRLDERPAQAAAALGAKPQQIWWRVTLPMLAPAIASAASLVFLFCATAFGVVMVLGGMKFANLETEIWIQTTQFLNLRTAAVLSVVQLLVVVAALTIASRARRRRENALALQPGGTGVGLIHQGLWARQIPQAPRRSLGWSRMSVVVTVVTVIGLICVPIINLIARSLYTNTGWGFGNYAKLADPNASRSIQISAWDALGNSLRAATLAMLIAVIIGGLISIALSRPVRTKRGRRALGTLDAFFMLPLGVSAVTVGFGFLITLLRPISITVPGGFRIIFDAQGSGLLIPLAQAVVAVPLVIRVVLPTLRAIDPRQREVAATLGASPVRVLMRVDGPIVARAGGLALGFAFAVSLGEFGATSFLARSQDPTLPVVIHKLISSPGQDNYGMALAASVILAATCGIIMALMERLRGDVKGEI